MLSTIDLRFFIRCLFSHFFCTWRQNKLHLFENQNSYIFVHQRSFILPLCRARAFGRVELIRHNDVRLFVGPSELCKRLRLRAARRTSGGCPSGRCDQAHCVQWLHAGIDGNYPSERASESCKAGLQPGQMAAGPCVRPSVRPSPVINGTRCHQCQLQH